MGPRFYTCGGGPAFIPVGGGPDFLCRPLVDPSFRGTLVLQILQDAEVSSLSNQIQSGLEMSKSFSLYTMYRVISGSKSILDSKVFW